MLVFAVFSARAAREDGKAPERRTYQCFVRAKLKTLRFAVFCDDAERGVISLREEQRDNKNNNNNKNNSSNNNNNDNDTPPRASSSAPSRRAPRASTSSARSTWGAASSGTRPATHAAPRGVRFGPIMPVCQAVGAQIPILA